VGIPAEKASPPSKQRMSSTTTRLCRKPPSSVFPVTMGERSESIHRRTEGCWPDRSRCIDFTEDRLASYRKSHSVDLVDDFPEAATGKIQRYELREQYWEDKEGRVGEG